MTELELYIGLQFDENKLEAPSILIDEFIHFANKAQSQYVNKRYNLAESKQQLTDDLQQFTKTVIVDREGKVTDRKGKTIDSYAICRTDLGLSFELPCNYLHILGCVVTFGDKCNTTKAARRLTSDIYGGIQDNAYLQPSVKRPFFYISENYLEIRSGKEEFIRVTLDYLKHPEPITLSQEIIDYYMESGEDTSKKLPYSDYIAYEILRELTGLILEMTTDPRLQSNPIVTQSIN